MSQTTARSPQRPHSSNASSAQSPMSRSARMQRTAECLRQAADTADDDVRHALLDEVVVLNMPMARSVAHRFRHKGVNQDDLDQVAYLALTRAARNFDRRHGRDFLSYAVPTIRGELRKYFRDSGWSIRPPRRIQELQGQIAVARDDLTQRLGRSPRPAEIADLLGEDIEQVIEALSTDGCFQPDSLDRSVNGDSLATLGDSLPGDSHSLNAADARLMLAPLIGRLNERDRRILDLRFFHDATQQEIADDIGVTQMHVSRLINRILAALRAELADTGSAD
jgi:RNA polymerase sigma-B factor